MAFIVDRQLQSLLEGFDALRQEYQRVYARCATLEANMEMAKSQVSVAHIPSSPPSPSYTYMMNYL